MENSVLTTPVINPSDLLPPPSRGPRERLPGIGVSCLPPLVLAAALVCIVMLVLGKVEVDRNQEQLYLGESFRTLQADSIFINHRDPFEENGIHAVLLPALVLKMTGSLGMMRSYLFLFSLAAIVLMYQICRRYGNGGTSLSDREAWFVALACASVWCAIPLIWQYPFQCNGMMLGFVCVVLAVLVYEKRPALAMVLFGFAAASKGQFLTYFPTLLLYQFLIRRGEISWTRRILPTLGDLLLLLAPHLLLAVLAMLLGWFRSHEEFIQYLFMQVTLVASFIAKALRPFFDGQGQASASWFGMLKDRYWMYEFHTYGPLSWTLILFSLGSSLFFAGQSIYRLTRRQPQSPVDGLLGFALLPFWVNFLLFWGYPYWYNVLAVLPFNVYFFVRLSFLMQRALQRRAIIPVQKAAPWVLGSLLVFLFINRVAYYRPLDASRRGNAFEVYPWMLK